MEVIGIDIGSSFLKVSLFDMNTGKLIEKKKQPSPKRLGSGTRFEVHAGDYVEFVRNITDTYAKSYNLAGVLLATQMHGFVYSTSLNMEDDIYVSWQDMRCTERMNNGQTYLEFLQGVVTKEDMKTCGVNLKPSLGSCNLYAMLDQNPDIPRNGRLYTIGSYIIEKLTGRNICHPTNAAPLGLLNVRDMCWDAGIINKLGFGDMVFPELALNDYKACGTYNTNGQSVPIFPDYGDQQIAILGCNTLKGDGVVNIATGCQVSVITDKFIPGKYELRPYFEGMYLSTISNMPAGRGLDVLINFIKEVVLRVADLQVSTTDVWQRIKNGFAMDTQGILVDMSFYATTENSNGGSISRITQNNLSINSLISAAFKDMAGTYKENFEILHKLEPISRVVCSGGVSWKNPELVEAIRQAIGLPCRLSPLEDEAIAGLYRAAQCCIGIHESMKDNIDLTLLQ